MVDPKKVEFSMYNGIPHLLCPVVTDPKKASIALKNIVVEMERRYEILEKTKNKNIVSYNKFCETHEEYQKLPYIVVIIDELADLMLVAAKEVEDSIMRITQMARAAGIHLIVATQRPSTDIITGVVKANIPSRISFAVSSQIDSRTILDMGGAEKLLGKGDMLFLPMGESVPMRIQGAYVSEEEIQKIEKMLKSHPLANEFDFIRSEKTLYEILPKGIGKGTSIINLCHHLNINANKAIAIGDYNNDISMFKVAGIGIAVSNACKEALDAADYITVSNEEHAIARVIYDLENGKYKL
jgi:DNA segregation ATPase FtsK/SpoIIIE-like protein